MSKLQWFQAATQGDVTKLKELSNKYAKSRDQQHRTALMYAAMNNQLKAVDYLSNFELGLQTDTGKTALMYAMAGGFFDLLNALRDEAKLTTHDQVTALMLAAANGMKQLGPLQPCTSQVNQSGLTALTISIAQKSLSLINQLFQFEGKLVNPKGLTPLMMAAACGRTDVLKFVMNQDPRQVRRQDCDGKTALRYALDSLEKAKHDDYQSLVECVKLLQAEEGQITAKDGVTSLMLCCQAQLVELAETLANSQIGMSDTTGKTALMYAAAKGDVALIKLLLADEQKKQDKNGRTALMFACENKHCDAFMELVESEYELRDIQEQHALHYAARSGAVDIVATVWETFEGTVDANGVTSLMEAARSNSVQCFQFLLKEVSLVDSSGRTALHYAAEGDAVDSCRQLLKASAVQSKEGKTAFQITVEKDAGGAFVALLTAAKSPSIFDAVVGNKYKICKAVADVARTRGCSLYPETAFTEREQAVCKSVLQQEAKNVKGLESGLNPLFAAVELQHWDVVRTLIPVFSGSKNKLGYTPLMQLVVTGLRLKDGIDQDQQYTSFFNAGLALMRSCGGMQTTKAGAYPAGATALMMGMLGYEDKYCEEILMALMQMEAAIKDLNGKDYLYHAEQAGVLEQVQQW